MSEPVSAIEENPIVEESSSAAMKTTMEALTSPMKEYEASQQQYEHCETARCNVCARYPYRPRGTVHSLLFHSLDLIDMDFGMFELVKRLNEDELDTKIDREVANETAETANRHVKYFRKKLSSIGLLNGVDQNYSGECSCARVVAVSWLLLRIYTAVDIMCSQPIICAR